MAYMKIYREFGVHYYHFFRSSHRHRTPPFQPSAIIIIIITHLWISQKHKAIWYSGIELQLNAHRAEYKIVALPENDKVRLKWNKNKEYASIVYIEKLWAHAKIKTYTYIYTEVTVWMNKKIKKRANHPKTAKTGDTQNTWEKRWKAKEKRVYRR